MVGNAIRGIQFVIGVAEKEYGDSGRYPAAKALGAKGGKARAATLMSEQRSRIARKAAAKR